MLRLWEKFQPVWSAEDPQADSHGWKAIFMWLLWQRFPPSGRGACPPEDAHRREALPLQPVWQVFHPVRSAKDPHSHPHWRETLYLQHLWQGLFQPLRDPFPLPHSPRAGSWGHRGDWRRVPRTHRSCLSARAPQNDTSNRRCVKCTQQSRYRLTRSSEYSGFLRFNCFSSRLYTDQWERGQISARRSKRGAAVCMRRLRPAL